MSDLIPRNRWRPLVAFLFAAALTALSVGCDDSSGSSEEEDTAMDMAGGDTAVDTSEDDTGIAEQDTTTTDTGTSDTSATDTGTADTGTADTGVGDSMVDTAAGETCDTGIQEGFDGACPETCPVFDACEPQMMTGTACTTECVADTPISSCTDDDGCCPTDCTAADDNDCGVPTTFRVDTLELRDPHTYSDFLGSCNDVTDLANVAIESSMEGDQDSNGIIDLSFLLQFAPFDRTATSPRNFAFGGGLCTHPKSTTTCTDNPAFEFVWTTIENGPPSGATVCMEPLAGTLAPYDPLPNEPSDPCFDSQGIDLEINLAGVIVPLSNARVGAKYNSDTELVEGLIYGFIDEATAEAAVFPSSAGPFANQTLASLLAGHASNCETPDQDDRDVGPDGTTLGWWFYLDFTAVEVSYNANP